MGEVRALAERLGEELDLNRVVWLEANLAAAFGRIAEAEAAFEQVRKKFSTDTLAFDYALVSLDLALLHLKKGNTGRVKTLAREMLWVFKSQRIHREALAALKIFCDAAVQEAATVVLTRSIRWFLQRALLDSKLKYGEEGTEVR